MQMQNNTVKNTSRLAWVDNVKMMAMLFVILGHTWRIIHCDAPVWMSLFIGTFNMPLFIMMTGYTSVRSIDKIDSLLKLKDYCFKITKRVLVPSAVFWSFAVVVLTILKYLQTSELSVDRIVELFLRIIAVVLFVFAFYVRNNEKGRIMFNILCILAIPIALKGSSYWFLSMIWCVCCAVAIASYIVHKIRNWGGYISLYILASLVYLGFAYTYSAIGASINIELFVHFFLIGYALSKFGIFDYLYKYTIVLSILSIAIGIALLGRNFVFPLSLVSGVAICLFFMLMIRKVSHGYNRFSYWGSQTLALYMVHAFIIYICYKLPFTYTIEGVKYLLYAIPTAAIITILSILIIKILMKYEVTRAYCLGEIK